MAACSPGAMGLSAFRTTKVSRTMPSSSVSPPKVRIEQCACVSVVVSACSRPGTSGPSIAMCVALRAVSGVSTTRYLSRGRVVAESIAAPVPLSAFTRSACDSGAMGLP